MPRKDSLRGCIIGEWKASGSPAAVQYNQVLAWARKCDRGFGNRGLDPAPKFRNDLRSGKDREVKAYLRGERFPFRMVDGLEVLSSEMKVVGTGKYAISLVLSLSTGEKTEHVFVLPDELEKATDIINNLAEAARKMLSEDNSVFILPNPWGFYRSKEIVHIELRFRTPTDWEEPVRELSKRSLGFKTSNSSQ